MASPATSRTLILAEAPLAGQVLAKLASRFPAGDTLVDFAGEAADVPRGWHLVRSDQLLDAERVQNEFLDWLETWPTLPLVAGRSFEESFRHTGGWSVWWTGPGSSRQPTLGPLFPHLRQLWLCRQAIDRHSPSHVVLHTRNRQLATMVASLCRRLGYTFEVTKSSPRPKRTSGLPLFAWLWLTVAGLLITPLWLIARALFARLTAGMHRESAADQQRPAVVMSGWYPQHVRHTATGSQVWYWQQLAAELAREPGLRLRYLLHTSRFRFTGWKKPLGLVYTGWKALRTVPGAMPLQQAYPAVRAYFAALPNQWRSLARYVQWERSPLVYRSLEFAGADVSILFMPALRHAVGGMAKWARTVDAIAQSLHAQGQVRCVLVHEEMYQKGMLTIAAARRLGIPTIGMQHGTFGPDHLVYRVPRGHVAGTPIPDNFAVYGAYAKEVISVHGAYPAERVWITGSPRFDALAVRTIDAAAARARLQLPVDKHIVLFTTERFAWSHKSCRALFEAAREMPDVVVCIKTHPSDAALNKYEALAQECGCQQVHYFRDRFDDLLEACDALVSGSSTTILEAMLCGKGAVCANFRDEPDRYPYVADGGALGARTLAEMQAAMQTLCQSESDVRLNLARQRFLLRHLGPTAQGAGASTLAGLIRQHYLAPDAAVRCA